MAAQTGLLQTVAAGGAKLLPAAVKISVQRLVILLAAVLAADGVELQLQAAHAEEREIRVGQRNHFRVRRGRRGAEAFHAELVEFAQTAGLRLFIAVAARQIAQLLRHRLVIEPVLQKRAHGARRALGAQRDGTVALVEEGVHLLLHHVGGVAHAALKQLGMLKHRGADLTKAVVAGNFQRRGFQKPDLMAFPGQDVLRALDGFGNQRHETTSNQLRIENGKWRMKGRRLRRCVKYVRLSALPCGGKRFSLLDLSGGYKQALRRSRHICGRG